MQIPRAFLESNLAVIVVKTPNLWEWISKNEALFLKPAVPYLMVLLNF